LSRVLRHVIEAQSSVSIGESQINLSRQDKAEQQLRHILPEIEVLTDIHGAKLIPIQEIERISRFIDSERDGAFRRGREEGYQDGYSRGKSEGLTKSGEVVQNFEAAIKAAVNQRESMLQQAKQKIFDLVIQISRKVTFEAVEVDPETTIGMISGVIDTLIDRSRLKIKVNPDHLPLVEQHLNEFLKGNATIKEITFQADPRVKFGGCFIETPTGDVDARLESQMDVIEEVISRSESEQ